MRRIVGALLVVLLLPLLANARSRVKIKKSQFDLKDAPNVLLITFDTTRADHLSCYGYVRRTSPTIHSPFEGVFFPTLPPRAGRPPI